MPPCFWRCCLTAIALLGWPSPVVLGYQPAEALADLAFLERKLTRSYRGTLQPVDWHQHFAPLRSRYLASDAELDTEDFYWQLVELLAPVVDGHFLLGQDAYSASAIADKYQPYHVKPLCQTQLPANSVHQIPAPHSERVIAFVRAKEALRLGGLSGGDEACLVKIPQQARQKPVPRQNTTHRLLPQWEYVRLGKLSTDSRDYEQLVNNAPLRKANLVIDLRDVDGGSVIHAERFLLALGLTFPCPYAVFKVAGKTGFDAFAMGLFLPVAGQNTPEPLTAGNWAQHLLPTQHPAAGIPPFTNQIVVLVNQYCASACEGIVAMLKSYKRTTLVGRQTRGASATVGARLFALPHSKIAVGFGSRLVPFFSRSGDFQENRGYVPDVWASDVSIWAKPQIAGFLRQLANPN